MTPDNRQRAIEALIVGCTDFKCEMCGAEPDCECLSIINGRPLRETGNRTTHYYRRTA
jgi:hypothetical protein